jgi:hypothetical protein
LEEISRRAGKIALREDNILFLLSARIKDICVKHNVFIMSATQLNGDYEDSKTPDQNLLRGAKAIADKCDLGYVMTRISDKGWLSLKAGLKVAVRDGTIPQESIEDDTRPTHILDIYKMRRGRYKMIRIWTRLHLGTGERKDLFITNALNQPIPEPIDLFSSASERVITIEKGVSE